MLPEELFLSLCRLQHLGAQLVPLGSRDIGAVQPNWPGGHCWGLGEEGLRTPSPASPGRRTLWGWVSGSRDPQQSSRAQGARGSTSPLFPKSSSGLGAKTACVAFLSTGAVGLMLLREECFLSLCRLQHQGAGLVALGRQSLEAERPSLPRGHYRGLGLDGLHPPNPASP